MLDKGRYGCGRHLSKPPIELMTADQPTAEQRASTGYISRDNWSWGLGMSVILKRNDLPNIPGRSGWNGGLGTSWYSDPTEDLVGVLMAQVAGFPSGIYQDF